ncbi:unnamed protein product [Lactuca saligna]|uniref:Uncharacterized protein n=1 Tax=Lactuca saligna TaxID=75948 RepID=A0AA35Z5Q7_LACSI|nr:unnamed protein product [Lactuca saligna]
MSPVTKSSRGWWGRSHANMEKNDSGYYCTSAARCPHIREAHHFIVTPHLFSWSVIKEMSSVTKSIRGWLGRSHANVEKNDHSGYYCTPAARLEGDGDDDDGDYDYAPAA